jgi:lysozyme family protein
MQFVLRWEGGFVDHPDDPGGRTNKGVTQRVYSAWLAARDAPARDVKLVSDAEIHAIYRDNYWRLAGCGQLPSPLDMVHFDTAVNMGVNRAVRFLQGSVGCSVDGKFGPATRKAVTGCDRGSTVVAYCDTREAFYRKLADARPQLAVFLRGWLNRLDSLRRECGLPGFESASSLDFGDTPYIRRIPDLGEDPACDF